MSSPSEILQLDVASIDPNEANALFRRVRRRLLPLLFIGYTFAFLDRINVGFTQLQMKQDLGITDAHFGLAAGLFFLTYVICEAPSNLLLERWGIRKQMLRIMVLWGLTSAATMFVRTPGQYYVERLLLGAFEGGFFPGMVLYLSYWLPSQERGKATGAFMVGSMVAGVFGGPVSGLIMAHMGGVLGLRGWQWCFLVEGLPCVLIGIACFLFFDDKPQNAKWLTAREKAIIEAYIGAERVKAQAPGRRGKMMAAIMNPRVYLLALLVMPAAAAGAVLNFWLPTVIKSLGVKSLANIGYLTMIPFTAAALSMIVLPYASDRFKERRLHIGIAGIVGAIAMTLAPQSHFSHSLGWTLALMSLLGIASNGIIATFWAIPAKYLGKENAAASIGLVTALGQLGPFFSPIVIGYFRTNVGSMAGGLYTHAAYMLLSALVMLFLVPAVAVRVGAEAQNGVVKA